MQDVPEIAPHEIPPEAGLESIEVGKAKYALIFVLTLLVLTLIDLRVEKKTDYGLARIERMWKGSNPVFTELTDQGDLPGLARELNLDWRELQTGQYVVETYLNQLEKESGSTWGRILAIEYGDYRIIAGHNLLLDLMFALGLASFFYLRARLKRAEELITLQANRHQKLNEQLRNRVEESSRIIEKFDRLQGKLLEAEKLASIGRLSATLAHEIRNPLSIIKSSTEIVMDEVPAESGGSGAVSLIREEVDRMDRIVSDLLNFARPKEPKIDRHELKSLVRHWFPPVVEELEKQRIQIVPQFEEFDAEVLVDADLLYQVFLNIMWNAKDALTGHPNPHIFVKTEEANERYAKLIIKDTGTGMLPDQLQQVKEPFFTTKTQGTGLGLPLSIQLMEVMSGKLEIESEFEVGTTVTLYLRRADSQRSSVEIRLDTEHLQPVEL